MLPQSSPPAPILLLILSGMDPEQEEPQELSREPHDQKCGQRSPDKSERDQSWAFISDLQGKVLPGEPRANSLVGAAVWTETGGGETRVHKGRESVSVWQENLQFQ